VKLETLVDLAEAHVACPDCDCALRPAWVRVAGLAIVVDARCPHCDRRFAYDWPAGHALLHPALVNRQTGAAVADGSDWYVRKFVHCLASEQDPASVDITVSGECGRGRDAILVNCVDFLYSHVLLKLLSATRHLRESPEVDVVVIVPRLLRWLVPPGVVVVEVDLPLSRGAEWVEGLDSTVEEVLSRSSSVRISPAVSQPDVTPLDLILLGQNLTPTTNSRTVGGPLRIGFSLREDQRLWLGPPRLWVKVARRLLPSRQAQMFLLRRQHRNYARLARRVRERHPEAQFVAFGIGRPHGLPDYIEDLRTPEPVREELPWLDDYRSCRVIVGVHGANLLLPSLLAGAVVELLPTFKLPNINQDLIIPHEHSAEPKLLLFRYRIVPEECSPDSIAAITLSVIDHAAFHHQNMIENRRAYDTPGWNKPINEQQIAV
jgi:hypothetical protein